ncbi:MAG TPA: hypothetical protein VG711_05775, partial [Phycisphaerales bacterium]|nr:hypothetical protein [Phycisphaerales bacterium]
MAVRKNHVGLAVGVGIAASLLAGQAHGGIVILGNSGWQAEWDDSLNSTVDIVLDGVTSNAVFIEKSVQFTHGPVNGIFPAVAITFRQLNAFAVSNIVIDDEILTNSTGVDWTDFHMQLVDHGDAQFDPVATAASGGGGPIGWSINPFTTAVFSNDLTTLDIAGGVVTNGSIWRPGRTPTDGQLW